MPTRVVAGGARPSKLFRHATRAGRRRLLGGPPNEFIVIIGAMKCGTTTLFNHLSKHPKICSSSPKEPSYFAGGAKADRYAFDRWKYGGSWPDWSAREHRYALEASTSYTKQPEFPNAAERMVAAARSANLLFRFVYLVRNPIERIESHYRHGITADWGAHLELPRTGPEISTHVMNITRYATQLRAYAERFDRREIIVASIDELQASPQRLVDSVTAMLRISKLKIGDPTKRKHTSEAKVRRVAKESGGNIRGFDPDELLEWRLPDDAREWVLRELDSELRELEEEYGVVTRHWRL